MFYYNCPDNDSIQRGEIFISDTTCARDKNLLKKLNINYVLNVVESKAYSDIKDGIKLVGLPQEQAIDFIHHCLSLRGKIVVHGTHSVSCVIAYLITYYDKDAFGAITFLKRKRINPFNKLKKKLNILLN